MSVAAQGASVGPEVRIVAPASPLATHQRFVDVTVHFRATKGNCKYIDLLLAGQVVASYENPPSIKEGDHTFPNVDLGAVLNRGATLAAIGYQGSRNNPNGASDPNAPGAAIAAEGAYTLAVTATDLAGNTAAASLSFTIDKTPPVLTTTQDPPANAHGWNKGPVTVNFAATDTLSGVAQVSGPVTLGAEGAAQAVAGSATDRAGNTATASVTVNIDLTAPTLTSTLAPTPNPAGWNNADVTVSFAATDALSGIATLRHRCEITLTLDGAGPAPCYR